MPDNWWIVITDVKNSTRAVQQGHHETMNLIATGSMVAVLNIAYKANITVPFFFGGDGATFIIPPAILDSTMQALLIHQENTLKNYNLTLRVGSVPVDEIYRKGQDLTISKFKISSIFSIPVVIGNGLALAEKIIKGDAYMLSSVTTCEYGLDLTGMECRWDKISRRKIIMKW